MARRCASAALVTHLQQPGTASGVVFLSLEDETGIVNVILWPQVFEAQRTPALTASLLEVDGTLQNQHGVTHVVARRLHDRSRWLAGVRAPLARLSAEPRGKSTDTARRSAPVRLRTARAGTGVPRAGTRTSRTASAPRPRTVSHLPS